MNRPFFKTRWTGFVAFNLVVLSCMAAGLAMFGRRAWCECGGMTPWAGDIWSLHNSQHLIDPYFFTHILHGVIIAALLAPFTKIDLPRKLTIAIGLETIWEILENSPIIIDRYREATMAVGYTGDSIANSIFDVVACALGFLIATHVRWYWSVALFIVIEIVLLATIRDNLTLNVLMLISPIESIQQWQMQ